MSLYTTVTNYNGVGGSVVLTGYWYHHQIDSVMVVTELICDKVDDKYRFGYNGQMKVNEIAGVGNHNTAKYWELDTRTARRWNLDPVDQISISNYAVNGNNPILLNDPDGDCPNCVTAAIGAGIGALVGGAIEIGSQLYQSGSVNNWSAVGGSALQGGITGGAAGFTGGASLLTTAVVSGGANALGGAANRAVQGQGTTVVNVVTDATVGGILGAGGKLVGNVVKDVTNNLSRSAKGSLGEAVTKIKYGAQGYVRNGVDEVATGAKTATGRDAVAKFDHKMTNVLTGKKITVESKFNKSGYTSNQKAVVDQGYPVILDRTTSQGLGNSAKAATVGTGAGLDAQRNKKP